MSGGGTNNFEVIQGSRLHHVYSKRRGHFPLLITEALAHIKQSSQILTWSSFPWSRQEIIQHLPRWRNCYPSFPVILKDSLTITQHTIFHNSYACHHQSHPREYQVQHQLGKHWHDLLTFLISALTRLSKNASVESAMSWPLISEAWSEYPAY